MQGRAGDEAAAAQVRTAAAPSRDDARGAQPEYAGAMARPCARALAALLFVAVVWSAPSAARWPRPPTTEGQGGAIVTVDFRVLARDGTPVLDLKREDLVLEVGGRVRDVVALELMQSGSGPTQPQTTAAQAPPPPFVTNQLPAAGRDVVLIVDDGGIPAGREQPVREALAALVSALTPDDRVSLILPRSGMVVKSTTTRTPVVGAIAGLKGRAESLETPAELACRSRLNLDALLTVFETVVPSSPTVILFATNGFSPPTGVERIARRSGPDGPCEITSGDLEMLSRTAATSRAHLFGVQVIDDTASVAAAAGRDATAGLEQVARQTGNAVIRLMGDTAPAMTRIARQTSAYYLAAFEVPASERTGRSERVEVTVGRPDVEIHVRPSMVLPKAENRPVKITAPKPRDMLSAAKTFRDLPLRAIAYTSHASGDARLRVVAVFESSDPSARLTAAAAALFDATGRAKVQWTAQPDALKQPPVVAALPAPSPGTYRLRLAATDESGAGGTIDEDVTVSAARTVSLSALVLGTPLGNAFAPRLQFVDEQSAVAMLEIAGAPRTATVSVSFELAASEAGPALATLSGEVRQEREDLRVGHVAFPIGPMPPGDVVVRAVVAVDGQPLEGRPARTLRKVASRR